MNLRVNSLGISERPEIYSISALPEKERERDEEEMKLICIPSACPYQLPSSHPFLIVFSFHAFAVLFLKSQLRNLRDGVFASREEFRKNSAMAADRLLLFFVVSIAAFLPSFLGCLPHFYTPLTKEICAIYTPLVLRRLRVSVWGSCRFRCVLGALYCCCSLAKCF